MNLHTVFELLNRNLSIETKNEIKNTKADDLIMFHHGLGMWLRNNAGFWTEDGSGVKECYDDLKQIGLDNIKQIIVSNQYHNMFDELIDDGVQGVEPNSLCHPDNISFIIIQLYHLYMNNKWMY